MSTTTELAPTWAAVLVCALLSGQVAAQPPPLVVVINRASPASLEIGAYYARQRRIPGRQICRLEAPAQEEITRAEFDETIRAPLEAFLTRSGLRNRINYLVTTKGVPLKITDGAASASVDSELCLLFRDYDPKDWVLNPYYGANEPFARSKYGLYLVTRLTGYTVEDAKGLVDRALAAEASPRTRAEAGQFVLDVSAERDRSAGHAKGNDALRLAANVLDYLGATVKLERTDRFLTGERDVIGYGSWGSNDPHHENHGEPLFQWRPGAIATTFVSTNGRTFTSPPQYGQSLVADLIAEGVTGVCGNVYEPLLSAVAMPDLTLPAYARGHTLADSFYMGLRCLSWMEVIVGDPLCRAFRKDYTPALEVQTVRPQPDTGTGGLVEPYYDTNNVLCGLRWGDHLWFGTTTGIRCYDLLEQAWRLPETRGVPSPGRYYLVAADNVRLYFALVPRGRRGAALVTLNWTSRQWRRFELPVGLGRNITALAAAQGIVWIGTERGVARSRLAGEEWEEISLPTGARLPVTALAMEGDAVVAADQDGVYQWQPGQAAFSLLWRDNSIAPITDLAVVKGKVWVVGGGGVREVEARSGMARRYDGPISFTVETRAFSATLPRPLGSRRNLEIRDKRGNLVDFGLPVLAPDDPTLLQFGRPDLVRAGTYFVQSASTVLPSEECLQVEAEGPDLYILTRSGLVHHNVDRGTWTDHTAMSAASGFLRAGSDVWYWSRTGVQRVDSSGQVVEHQTEVPGDTAAVALAGGDVWLASSSFGLHRLEGPDFRRMTRVSGPADTKTVYALEATGDNLWIGTRAGLAQLDPATGLVVPAPLPGAPRQPVYALAEQAGLLWMGLQRGLWSYEPSAGTWARHLSKDLPLALPSVTDIRPDGSDLWVRCARGEEARNVWYRWARATDTWTVGHPLVDRAFAGRVYHVLPTAQALILTNDRGVLVRARGEKQATLFELTSDPSARLTLRISDTWYWYGLGTLVVYAARVNGQDLWLGTNRGLMRLQLGTGRLHLWNAANGLADDRVWSLDIAPDGTIWAGSPNGLSRVRPSGE